MRFFYFLFLYFLFLTPAEASVSEEWQRLLHYEKKGNEYVSVVENDEFFLAPDGRTNPQAEYQATITQFNLLNDLKKCDFPARFLFLKKKGEVTGTLDACTDYQAFLEDVQPKAVTMLFTNAYMSNPSSLFGHTLFRIDTKRKGTQLLAHGANFGADTGDETGVLYALKGLWGGYFGTFGIKPYYDIINMYNNIENRDIWEYELGFSDEELELFTAHLWEMKQAKIRYYFTSQNCSYVLLLMLEAVRADLKLSEEFQVYTAPLATLKAVHNVSGLVKHTSYRPSRQSKLQHRLAQMSKKQIIALENIIKRNEINLQSLTEEEKADVLETAYQYLQYRYVERELELADYRQKSLLLLRERSKIANQKQYFDELKEGENPVLSHKPKQVSLLLGARRGEVFQEIGFKPIYNSLMEDSYGLLKGAEINLFETKLRHYDAKNKYSLQEVTLLDITSLSGADIMFQPFSYDIKIAYKEIFDSKTARNHGVAFVEAGAGQSYTILPDTLFYILTVPQAAWGGGLRDNAYVGASFKGGIYYNHDKVRLKFQAAQTFATDYVARGQNYTAEIGYGLTRNTMLYAEYQLFNTKYKDDESIMGGIKISF